MNSAWSVKFVRVFMGHVCYDVKEFLTGLSFVSTGAPLCRINLQKKNSTVLDSDFKKLNQLRKRSIFFLM